MPSDPGACELQTGFSLFGWLADLADSLIYTRNHCCQQGCPRHQMLNHHRLMPRVSTLTDCSHPIERRHPKRSREVTIRATTGSRLLAAQNPAPQPAC